MKPKLQIVLPVLNEEISLKKHVLRLYKIISDSLTEYEWTITIVNNGSIDRTIEIAYKLSNKYSEISFSKLELNKSYKSNLILRPQQSVVGKTPISDIVIKIDDALFEGISFRSIGSGYLIQKLSLII